MRIELGGQRACLHGERTPIMDGVAAALQGNGATVAFGGDGPLPDILLFGFADWTATTATVEDAAAAMMQRGSGRVIFLTHALAAVPARRFPEASIAAGATVLFTRTLAMRFGPAVLVNAIGCGAIAGPDGTLLTGDASMLSHVPDGEPGAVADIVHAVLFLCDPLNSYMSGQLLTVDGGWSPGYGRNF